MLQIGRVAKAAGLPVKTVRYYDEIGLIKANALSEKGYRLYDDRAVHKLIFIRHARAFGFSIEVCRELLDCYENPARTSQEVKAVTARHLVQIREKMAALQQLHDSLAHLADHCHGDERPDCPIIDYLANPDSQPPGVR